VKKVVVLYQAPVSAMEQMSKATPEQAKAGMDAWMAWAKNAGNAVIDLGMPLGNDTVISQSGTSKGKTQITGFSILQGESMEQITGLLKDHPHLHMPGSSIEVLEGLSMPGM